VQPETGYTSPHSSRLQQPDADHHYNQNIQNRFDTGGHGNVPVDQVQRHTDYDQYNDKIYQRHFLAPSIQEEQSFAQCPGGEACATDLMRAGLPRTDRRSSHGQIRSDWLRHRRKHPVGRAILPAAAFPGGCTR
jgi:hypothetical protein